MQWQAMAARLAQAAAGKSQAALAKAINAHQSTVSLYLAGKRRPTPAVLARLCQELGISADYVLGLNQPARGRTTLRVAEVETSYDLTLGMPTEAVHLGGVAFIPVPKLRDPIAAGNPILTDGSIDEVHFIRLDWIGRRIRGRIPIGRVVLLDVATSWLGESMAPTIKPGAMIFADRGQECDGPTSFEPGSIYLVRHEGGVTCKRIWQMDGSLSCHSDSLAHPPFTIPLQRGDLDEIRDHLAAKVFWVGNPVP